MSGLLKAAEEVEKLGKDLDHKVGMVDNIRTLIQKFPDLMVYRPFEGRKYDIVCCSSSVNTYVDAYDYTEGDDVEDPRSVFVWPYTLINGLRVYSNPPYVRVGAINTKGFGITPDEYWEEALSQENIPLTVIRKIRGYLRSKPPINYTE